MKKVILGSIIIAAQPFIAICGAAVIYGITPSENVTIFASAIGGVGIVFNMVIGGFLVVSGYQDLGTFKNL